MCYQICLLFLFYARANVFKSKSYIQNTGPLLIALLIILTTRWQDCITIETSKVVSTLRRLTFKPFTNFQSMLVILIVNHAIRWANKIIRRDKELYLYNHRYPQ